MFTHFKRIMLANSCLWIGMERWQITMERFYIPGCNPFLRAGYRSVETGILHWQFVSVCWLLFWWKQFKNIHLYQLLFLVIILPCIFFISLADVSILEDSNVMFKVGRDGVVEWKLPRIFTTFCNVDVTYYPFDTQNCVIEVTSWAYTVDELEMRASRDSVNLEDMKYRISFSQLISEVCQVLRTITIRKSSSIKFKE